MYRVKFVQLIFSQNFILIYLFICYNKDNAAAAAAATEPFIIVDDDNSTNVALMDRPDSASKRNKKYIASLLKALNVNEIVSLFKIYFSYFFSSFSYYHFYLFNNLFFFKATTSLSFMGRNNEYKIFM